MIPYFLSKERQEALFEILESWKGTPYKHHTGFKRLGVDCAFFIGCVLVELGAINNFEASSYSIDFHLHSRDEGFANHLRNHPLMQEVGFKNPRNGDIVLYKLGRIAAHAAFYFDGYAWQSKFRLGVEKFHWSLDYKRLAYGFRLMDK